MSSLLHTANDDARQCSTRQCLMNTSARTGTLAVEVKHLNADMSGWKVMHIEVKGEGVWSMNIMAYIEERVAVVPFSGEQRWL